MSEQEDIAEFRANVAEELSNVDATKAGGLPDSPGSAQHVGYFNSRVNALKSLADAEAAANELETYEGATYGVP